MIFSAVEHAPATVEVGRLAVAEGEEEQAPGSKIAAAEIRDVPAQPRIDQPGELGSPRLKLLR